MPVKREDIKLVVGREDIKLVVGRASRPRPLFKTRSPMVQYISYSVISIAKPERLSWHS